MYVGAVFFPLLGACISGFLGRWIGDRAAMWSTVACMALAAACGLSPSGGGAGRQPSTHLLFTWMSVGELEFAWSLRYDTLSAVMVGMVTLISTLIHLYSIGYMSH
jgi:NADH-quinone oxidoreductase subunit L